MPRTREEGRISLHFEGEIVHNHFVSARTLGKTLIHSQNAIDRAYLDLKYGNLWKHARMKGSDYHSADFIALYPREGGFVQELISNTGKRITDRIASALTPAFERATREGEENLNTFADQIRNRKRQISNGLIEPRTYGDAVNNPDAMVVRTYADRSINREIDQVLSILRSQHSGESFLNLEVYGSDQVNYDFNRQKSERFHRLVSRREVGSPVIYTVKVRQLDRDRLSGKVVNSENEKTINVHFLNDQDFVRVHPYLGNNEALVFIGSPIIEYGAFDPAAGDVYFIDMV